MSLEFDSSENAFNDSLVKQMHDSIVWQLFNPIQNDT